MTAPLFAIGGGEIADEETRPIDTEIVDATDASESRLLFLPTASGDAEPYIEGVQSYFGDALGCDVDVLRLVGKTEIDAESAEKIGAADAVYVGGGDTGYMLEVWRTRGIDDLLREAWRDGTVLSGLSAGAICWFAGGVGDTVAVPDIDYGPVTGLGFVPGLHVTPHATPERREAFAEYLAVRGTAGIALENNAAIEVVDGRWRVHTGTADARAYHVPPGGETGAIEVLPSDGTYRPITELR